MSEQAKPVGASDKMKAKDFITLGIFTVLFFAVVMVCIFASAATVVTFAFGSAIAAIPGGIIYMLMRAKVPKAGSVLLSGVVIGLIEFLIGAGWAVAVGFIAAAGQNARHYQASQNERKKFVRFFHTLSPL